MSDFPVAFGLKAILSEIPPTITRIIAKPPRQRILQFPGEFARGTRQAKGEPLMEQSGTALIKADRDTVWAALNDPEALRACIPGCSEFSRTRDGGFEATVTQKVGPVKATFRGRVELSDVVELESYTISGEGKGGAAGFAKGTAKVSLADADGGTELAYVVSARVGGKLAQIGSRLVSGAAKKFAEKFFNSFKNRLSGTEPGS